MTRNRKAIALTLFITVTIAIAYVFTTHKKTLSCSATGDFLKYQNGKKIEEKVADSGPVNFELVTYPYINQFKLIDAENYFPAHQINKLVFDSSKSSGVDNIFNYDETNIETKFRTVTSLTLNQISGDIRLFHHYWIPPNEWQNSTMYSYSGFCLPKQQD